MRQSATRAEFVLSCGWRHPRADLAPAARGLRIKRQPATGGKQGRIAPSSPGAPHHTTPTMETTIRNIVNFCVSDWAPACERIARALAVAIVATYAAGYAAGRILHRWNDRIAAIASGRRPHLNMPHPAPIDPRPTYRPDCLNTGSELAPIIARSCAPIICQPQAAAPIANRPAAIAPPALDTLTVAQLRSIARQRLGSAARIGGRRIAQARRAAILEALA